MKNIFRKNQVIITALAIMIAVAGYLQFTGDKVGNNSNDLDSYVATDGITTIDEDALVASEDAAMGGDVFASIKEDPLAAETASMDEANTEESNAEVKSDDSAEEVSSDSTEESSADISDEDIFLGDVGGIEVKDTGELADSNIKEDTIGEAVLVTNTINNNFFSSARLTREQTRAKNKSTLMEMIDSKNISDEQKQDVIDSLLNMTTINDKENATEIQLEAKGFTGNVVRIIDAAKDSVDVIISASSMTEQDIAVIEDIVKNKTGIPVENITITPVTVE